MNIGLNDKPRSPKPSGKVLQEGIEPLGAAQSLGKGMVCLEAALNVKFGCFKRTKVEFEGINLAKL